MAKIEKVKKSDETRTRILEAALRVFRERGFEKATMREIAKARPMTLAELRGVSGVGERKLESYGSEIISLIESL